jgi:hypothetical protein
MALPVGSIFPAVSTGSNPGRDDMPGRLLNTTASAHRYEAAGMIIIACSGQQRSRYEAAVDSRRRGSARVQTVDHSAPGMKLLWKVSGRSPRVREQRSRYEAAVESERAESASARTTRRVLLA